MATTARGSTGASTAPASSPLAVVGAGRDSGAATPQPATGSVLVPLDGSRLSRAAIAPAERLARQLGVPLVFVQAVAPARVPGVEPAVAWQLGESDAQRSLRLAASSASSHGLSTAEVLIKGGLAEEPADAILTAARDLDASLIVMATHGRTGLRRALLGSVADAVVAGATVPVVLVPDGMGRGRAASEIEDFVGGVDERSAVTTVSSGLLIALDGSAESEASLAPAIKLAHALGGDVVLVRVVPEQLGGPANTDPAMAYLQAVTERLVAAGIAAERIQRLAPVGPPSGIADTLLDCVTRTGAGMVAIATHARRGLPRLLQGSCESALVARATVPLLVVRTQTPE